MNATPEENAGTGTARRRGIGNALVKPLLALGLLVVVWFVFGQVIPRLTFPAAENSHKQVAAVPAAANAHYEEQIATLSGRVDQLEARLKAYEDIITALPAPQPAVPETIITTTAGTPMDDADVDRLARLEQKIAVMQAQLSQNETRASAKIAALTAFSQMKEAALRGDVFAGQHAELSKQTQDRSDIQKLMAELAPYADKGIITLGEAQKQFEALIPKALASHTTPSTLDNVTSLITIRKVGEQPGGDDEAILARAEHKLAQGDAGAALKEIGMLSPNAAAVFAGWADAIRANAKARVLFDHLQLALIRDEAPTPTPMPATAPAPIPPPAPDAADGAAPAE